MSSTAPVPPVPRVSAIVPTLDRPDWLARALAALAAARPAFHEVIVADQSAGLALETGAALCAKFGARHLPLSRRGLSRARNAAIAIAAGEWFAFPDDDAEVSSDVLAVLAAHLAAEPGTAFVCGHVAYPSRAPMQPGMDGHARQISTPVDVLQIVVSPGLFVRADAVARAGGFDEELGVGATYPSGEESDLLFTVLAQGGRGAYVPALRVAHPDPFEIRDEAAQQRRMESYGRGWGALFAKHAARPGGEPFARLQRHYERRARMGMTLAALTLRPALAARYRASLAGRRAGWEAWRAAHGAARAASTEPRS